MHLNNNNNIICTLYTLLYIIINSGLSLSLRDVRVEIPQAVRKSEKAILKCLYDLEDDSLYSVKWYKGRREFYSFTPKDNPAMKVFQFSGVKVDRSSSNESQLVLETVNAATSGKYSCEVSADAPSFHTLIGAGELEVVPGKDPIIAGIRSRYKVGDIVRGNCTSSHSRPAANITWTVNGYETNPAHIRHFKPHKEPRELETVISAIHFVVIPQHFINGKLKIRCTAFIHDVYWKSTERSIEENRFNKDGTSNVVHKFSEDYFDLDEDNVFDRSDTYLTHIKGDVSSLNANGCLASHKCSCFWPRLAILSLVLYAVQQLFQLLQQLLSQTTKDAIAMEKAKQNGGNCQTLTTPMSANTEKGSNLFEMKTTKAAIKQKQAQQYITTSLATQVSTISYENKSTEEYFQIKLIKENNQQLLIVQEKLWKFQLKYSNTLALLLNCYQPLKHAKLQLQLQLACDKTQYEFVCNSAMTTTHVANNFPTNIVTIALDLNILQYMRVCQQLCNQHKSYAQFCTAFPNSCSDSLNTVTCLNASSTGSSTLTAVLLFAAKETKL